MDPDIEPDRALAMKVGVASPQSACLIGLYRPMRIEPYEACRANAGPAPAYSEFMPPDATVRRNVSKIEGNRPRCCSSCSRVLIASMGVVQSSAVHADIALKRNILYGLSAVKDIARYYERCSV